MRDYQIVSKITVFEYEELSDEEKELIDVAREMTLHSYAPYSHFYVGAALRLKNGVVVPGCNQENAASPATICAERSAIFGAGAQYPDQPVMSLAITACNDNGFMQAPIPPCGTCRQVMKEFAPDLEVICLNGKGESKKFTLQELLPYSFDGSML